MDETERPRVSYDQMAGWQDERRWEIIDGHPFQISAPSPLHQEVVGSFYVAMALALRGKRCRVYLSPIHVRLSDWDAVQPDLAVICDREQVRSTHLEGPPAIAVEVVSPSSSRHDRIRKLRLYAKFRVQEYWLVSTMPPVLEVLVLDGDTYRIAQVHSDAGRFQSPTVPDLDLDLAAVFEPCDTSGLEEIREAVPPYVTQAR